MTADEGEPAGARLRRAWGATRKCSGAELGEGDIGRADATTGKNRTADSARRWSDRPTLLLQGGAGSASRGSLASPPHQQTGKEPRQEWNLDKAFRRKPAVVREVEHVGNDTARSSTAMASTAWEERGCEQGTCQRFAIAWAMCQHEDRRSCGTGLVFNTVGHPHFLWFKPQRAPREDARLHQYAAPGISSTQSAGAPNKTHHRGMGTRRETGLRSGFFHHRRSIRQARVQTPAPWLLASCCGEIGACSWPPPTRLDPSGGEPVKGFHLTNGRLPDAAKRLIMACQDVVPDGRRPDANALHDTSRWARAFTIHVRAALMPQTVARERAKV